MTEYTILLAQTIVPVGLALVSATIAGTATILGMDYLKTQNDLINQ